MIKPYTAHNDKLGFNWDVPAKKYVVKENVRHFKTSSYPALIQEAIIFLSKEDNTYRPYVSHLQRIASSEWGLEPILNQD